QGLAGAGLLEPARRHLRSAPMRLSVGDSLRLYSTAGGKARGVFGTVRYMSSENVARKFRVAGYLQKYGERRSAYFDGPGTKTRFGVVIETFRCSVVTLKPRSSPLVFLLLAVVKVRKYWLWSTMSK